MKYSNDNLAIYINGGGRGIRTPAGFDTPFGFQDRPLQPDLGIPPCPTFNNIQYFFIVVNNFMLFCLSLLQSAHIPYDHLQNKYDNKQQTKRPTIRLMDHTIPIVT